MEKTLYLRAHPKTRIIRDGSSLWIEQDGKAGRRVPARLIRRVVLMGNVALTADSLLLFAARGIPVTLLDRDGAPAASLFGVAEGAPQRRARQAARVEEAAWCERAAAWLAAWERGRQLALAARVDPVQVEQWRRKGVRPGEYETWLQKHTWARRVPFRAQAFFRGALHELIASELALQGWDPHPGVRHPRQPLGFVRDCAMALQADADGLALACDARLLDRVRTGDFSDLVRAFESGRPRIERRLGRMLTQYCRLVWEP